MIISLDETANARRLAMYCPKCGKELQGAVNYCCQCGAALSKASPFKRKLTLSTTDKKIAGVCGGLAEYLEIDSTFVRLIWVLLALAGLGLIGYPIAWLIMPSGPVLGKASKIGEPSEAATAPTTR
jgi:phage shock protein C